MVTVLVVMERAGSHQSWPILSGLARGVSTAGPFHHIRLLWHIYAMED
jgi:hypothetical protein